MAIQPVPNYTPVPTPVIQRGDRETFSNRVDMFISWLQVAPPQFKALADVTYNNASEAAAAADSAVDSAIAAGESETSASASAAAALSTVPVTSTTPPPSPAPNAVWIHSDTGREYTYLLTAAGYKWVETKASIVYLSPTSAEDQAFLPLGLGAISRSTRDKLRDEVSGKDFGAKGDGTTDDRAALQKAIDASPVIYLPPGIYMLSAALSVPSNRVIYGYGAKLKLMAGATSHVIRIADNADNVTIDSIGVDGSKAVAPAAGNGISTGGAGATNVRVYRVAARDCTGNGIYFGGTLVSRCGAYHCEATGNGLAGIAGDSVEHFSFNDNRTWLNGTYGVGLIGIGKHGTINNNVSWENGQGAEVADNITGYNSGNYNVTVSNNTTWGGLNNGVHMGGSRIVMNGNTSFKAKFYGVVLRNHDGTPCEDCVVSNNTSFDNGLSGFWFDNCINLSGAGNTARNNKAHGYAMDSVSYSSFHGTAYGNTLSGFKNQTASSFVTLAGCVSVFNGAHGLDMTNMTDSIVSGGSYSKNTGWGIQRSGTDARNTIVGLRASGNTAGQIAAPPISTRVAQVETNTSRTIVAAAALTLPPNGEYFNIAGNTAITSITPSWVERRVTLHFDDALTVTDGGNLRLAGNFVTTFMDTITLISDGVNWVECSRSVN